MVNLLAVRCSVGLFVITELPRFSFDTFIALVTLVESTLQSDMTISQSGN